MLYSPFNHNVWLFFLGGMALVFLAIYFFGRRYPDYPHISEDTAVTQTVSDIKEKPFVLFGNAEKNEV